MGEEGEGRVSIRRIELDLGETEKYDPLVPDPLEESYALFEDFLLQMDQFRSTNTPTPGKRSMWFTVRRDNRDVILDVEDYISEKSQGPRGDDIEGGHGTNPRPVDKKPGLMLHVCCACCLAGVIDSLEKYFDVHLIYFNPNIHPSGEKKTRLDNILKFLEKRVHSPLVPDGEDKDRLHMIPAADTAELWSNFVEKPLDDAIRGEKREDGPRCLRCYFLRLFYTARAAASLGLPHFATTLTISPHKSAQHINTVGTFIALQSRIKRSENEGQLVYLESNFKKGGGFELSKLVSREHDLYRQDYCGCHISLANRDTGKRFDHCRDEGTPQ